MKLLSFRGRINRRSYIKFQLRLIFYFLMILLGMETVDFLVETLHWSDYFLFLYFLFIPLVVYLLLSYPSLMIRRFHDLGKSGWYILLGFIPIMGLYFSIYLLYFKRGHQGPNQYGEAIGSGI